MTSQQDLALTTIQLLANAAGAEFEDEQMALDILTELINQVKKPE